MKTLKETKILGFPLWMFLVLAVLMMIMAANDWMLTNMVGALAFAMVVGTLLGWVGDHIPVWKKPPRAFGARLIRSATASAIFLASASGSGRLFPHFGRRPET